MIYLFSSFLFVFLVCVILSLWFPGVNCQLPEGECWVFRQASS